MLRLPVKLALILGGIFGVVIGAHGLYIHFSTIELLFGGKNPSDLFLAVDVPHWLDGIIEWSSLKGFESWVIPAIIIIAGLVVSGAGLEMETYQRFSISGLLRKWKLW